ncbi:MAG: polysaccharide pyruvyl transferase family protein [Flavobacteriales bacterium]|nr:polysaccharide pyruvyl transferase family protein [Flavobacteriales bacterium]
MKKRKHIRLFYWSSVLFENKVAENYGDLLSKYIVEKVSGRKVEFYNAPKKRKALFKPRYLMAIGSIMSYASERAVVWGSGIITKNDRCKNATFAAVRGPKSRERLQELGYSCPEVYGDPALLLSHYYKPHVKKTHRIGIIPHYIDHEQVAAWYANDPSVKVINLIGDDVAAITNEILSCKQTVSSSLHGVIVSHAYGIPSVWTRYSEKLSGDNIKFEDYFLSVGLTPYTGNLVQQAETVTAMEDLVQSQGTPPNEATIKQLQYGLLEAFPKKI